MIGKAVNSAKRPQPVSRGTFFDQLYNRQQHKAYQLARKSEQRTQAAAHLHTA